MTSEQSNSQVYDDVYFENIKNSLPAEYQEAVTDIPPLKSYHPLRLTDLGVPRAVDYDGLVTVDKDGNPKGLNRNRLIPFLESNLIVHMGHEFRKFDGRRYAPMSEDELSKLISRAVYDHGFVPRDSDVNDFVKVCRALLERDIYFPANVVGSDLYENQPLIAFQNGIYNMESHQMLPFTPYLPVMHYIRADFDPTIEDAPARAVIEGIIPDPQTRDFLYEMIGYILFEPTMNPPSIFVLYGPTETGKSALATIIEEIVGLDSVTHMNMRQLTAQFGPADIEGKLLNVCKETGDESAVRTNFNGELLKNMTSGEIITVEKKHKDQHEIIPTAKTLFCTNTPPDFGDDSSGLLRRLHIIPCRQPQKKKDRIYDVLRLPQSKSYIVNKAYHAYLAFKAKGDFTPSPLMIEEKKFYKTQNSILDFLQNTFGTDDKSVIRDKLVSDPELKYTAVFYNTYTEYCGLTLAKPVGRKRFFAYMRNEFNLTIENEGVYYDNGTKHTTRDVFAKAGVC